MYPEYMQESLKKIEKSRPQRLKLAKSGEPIFSIMSAQERETVLKKFHPDYKETSKRTIKVGPNKGGLITAQVADILEAHPRVNIDNFNLKQPDYTTDLLIIGGGGAGCAAAIMAQKEGIKSIIATKLRTGDANSMMSQGGIQAAVNPQDSPVWHYLDTIGGGHFDNKPELVQAAVNDAPLVIDWLENLGVIFDKDKQGELRALSFGGYSRKRMLSCRDYTGMAIMRTLMDEVKNHPEDITLMEFFPAVELLLDEKGHCAGAVVYNLETREYFTIKANATIISTGGFGRLHINGYDTTNHYGATCDGPVIAYRAGARLLYMDSVQYHPTGAAYPEQIAGFLVTEKVRGAGGQVLNKEGEIFVYPKEPRDVETAAIIRECMERKMGIKDHYGRYGVWLDSPIINQIQGEGFIEREYPAMVRQFKRFNIDMTKEPLFVFPTLHYQNGGVEINEKCETNIPGLFVAGEASGGLHGRNRLMGNSILDYNVFGRRAGMYAGRYAKEHKAGKLSLEHVKRYQKQLKSAGIETDKISPVLLPDYTPEPVRDRQFTAHYEGTLR
ncbi:MAG: FAD-binding protein [Candidatus Omnitrophota bacterium]|nr:MAG: FAD-binding protein [Candidatus Omnitrophota bacterium]